MYSSKGNDFGAFLGTINQAMGSSSSGMANYMQSDPAAKQVVWDYLVSHKKASIAQLMSSTPISYGAMASALDSLRGANLVQVTQSGNEEFVEITPTGQQVADIGLK